MGVGLPFQIDPLTLSLYQGLYARVFVEIYCSKSLPEQILVTKKNAENQREFEFFAKIEYETVPKFCVECEVIGHDEIGCRRLNKAERWRGRNEEPPVNKMSATNKFRSVNDTAAHYQSTQVRNSTAVHQYSVGVYGKAPMFKQPLGDQRIEEVEHEKTTC